MGVKRSNQSIEEIAENLLDKDKLITFLNFYKFLNANKLGKVKTGITSWTIKYKAKRIGAFRFHGNLWLVSYFKSFTKEKWFEKCEKYLSADLKEFVLNNINTTPSCGNGGCKAAIEDVVILEKEFDRVCSCEPIKLINPDGKTLVYAKELVLIGKSIIGDLATDSI